MTRSVRLALLLFLSTFVSVHSLSAQGLLDRAKKRAEDKAKQKAEQATDKAVDKGFEVGEKAVSCTLGDAKCASDAKKAGKPVQYVDDKGKPVTTEGAGGKGEPGKGAWANYDFVPGEKALFADDFAADVVGDFPRRWELEQGSLELVEWEGQRYLRAASVKNIVAIPLPETLPERFTIEFDYFGAPVHSAAIVATGPAKVLKGSMAFDFTTKNEMLLAGYRRVGWSGAGGSDGFEVERESVTDVRDTEAEGKTRPNVYRWRAMVDGKYVKVYVNERRVANVPNASLGRAKRVLIAMSSEDEQPTMIGNVRIAAGGRDLYDALTEKGRVALQGIYFDTGSDRLRPESTPTLKQIGTMLKEHADLKLAIEGHTDNVGKSDFNKQLSQERAEAVQAYLVKNFAVDASRLTAAGLGDTKPAASNDSPEGRQQNRRVELVKK